MHRPSIKKSLSYLTSLTFGELCLKLEIMKLVSSTELWHQYSSAQEDLQMIVNASRIIVFVTKEL